jgi:flavin reductase (DIM6/NTAB) family NADH-FMN oxidoreductase RutF
MAKPTDNERQVWKPGTMVYPVPAVLVSCGSTVENRNLITVAWTGTICTNPAMLSISVRPERHSHTIISEEKEFTVNLTTTDMARATDWCGVKSGRDFDKWKETGLTPVRGVKNSCFYVGESPLAIECRVKDVIRLGSHDMFIAEVLDVLADSRWINPETGAFDARSAGLMAYCHGAYYQLGDFIGRFGFSVMKKKK